jgi:site-specific recombinase XerD
MADEARGAAVSVPPSPLDPAAPAESLAASTASAVGGRPSAVSAAPSLPEAIAAFGDTLVAKSPRTAANYLSALRRFVEFLPSAGLQPESVPTDRLPADILERFYTWLLRAYGREHKRTAVAYASEVRAFFRFLDRRRWLSPGVSFEHLKDGLRELIGRQPYPTPRVDDAVALVVTYVNALPLPPPGREHERQRLALLRDRALLATLWATGMRREELSRLNRADVQDGRVSEALVTGKGGRERVVFLDQPAMYAMQSYVEQRTDPYPPLFLRHDDGRGRPGPRGERWRLSPQSVWAVVKRYGKLAGVEVTTHHLRHLKARILLNNGAQLGEVQDILGHASPETTKKIYAPYTTQHLREAFDRFSRSAEEVAQRVDRGRGHPR